MHGSSYRYSEQITKVKTYKKYISTHNSAIFELQIPDFAPKFVWTVRTNDERKNFRGVRRGRGSEASKSNSAVF